MDKSLDELTIDMEVKGVDKAFQESVISQMRSIDGIEEYLRLTMESDVKRVFYSITPHEQMLIRGAYYRTAFLLKLIREAGEPAKPKAKPKSVMSSKRHAS